MIPVANINYLELFICAVKFIHTLKTRGIGRGDSVVLGQLQPHLAVITIVALSMSGIASIPAEAAVDVDDPSASAIITEIHFPGIDLPVIDPPQYDGKNGSSTEEIPWSKLPEIREEEQFLFDITSGTFASHAEVLTALFKDYKSMSASSLGDMLVLYADRSVVSRMLGVIWQVLLHGGSICGIVGDVQRQSIPTLASIIPHTHICVDEDTLVTLLTKDVDAKDTKRPKIILPREPTSPVKDLLAKSRLSYIALHGYHMHPACHEEPTRVQDPIRVILSRNSDPDLTPENVLLYLETSVNLNKFPTGSCVKQIYGNKVVKYGGLVCATEAFNMEYARTRTKINIPTVHLVFYHAGSTYIVMDYVPGRCLQDAWASFDQNERLERASQIAGIVDQLRAIPHSTIPGPPDPSPRSRCEGPWFTTFGAGPFQSHHDLAKWLNRKLSLARKDGDGEKMSSLPIFDGTSDLVFTHQDLAARNLILADNGDLWVIDWELAGWYPEYFEYACIASDTGSPEMPVPKGWKETVLPYLKSYKQEYEMLQSICWVLNVMPFS